MPKIAIVADYDSTFEPHLATDAALLLASTAGATDIKTDWLPTLSLATADHVSPLTGYDGFLIAPGSPYKSLQGAVNAIQFARERGLPLLATYGGFQHVVIEYARNVLGFKDAQHAEYDPYASPVRVGSDLLTGRASAANRPRT
jgi:CTP synthase (UTP-ammonia lyase)